MDSHSRKTYLIQYYLNCNNINSFLSMNALSLKKKFDVY